jgi:hypothetical protein
MRTVEIKSFSKLKKEGQMKTQKKHRVLAVLLIGALAIMAPQIAMAGGTLACTSIDNTANISYSVNGTPQTGVPSTTANFLVGNKVIVSATNQDGADVTVLPGSTNQVLNFRITNNGNANQRYVVTLPAGAQASGTANPYPFVPVPSRGNTNDDIDMTTPGIGATGVATITTAVVIPDGHVDVTVVANTPNTPLNGDVAVYAIRTKSYKVDGTTAEDGTSGSITSAVGTCSTAIVLADTAAGTDDSVGARDGEDSARGAYKVSSAVLTFDKGSSTIWDPINGNNSPKSIPGALIQYTITVSNAVGAANATLTTITDSLAGSLAIDSNLKQPAACGAPPCALASLADGPGGAGKGFKVVTGGTSSRASATTPLYFTTTSSADGVDISGQDITATMATVLPVEAGYTAGLLKAGESVTLTFNVTIN